MSLVLITGNSSLWEPGAGGGWQERPAKGFYRSWPCQMTSGDLRAASGKQGFLQDWMLLRGNSRLVHPDNSYPECRRNEAHYNHNGRSKEAEPVILVRKGGCMVIVWAGQFGCCSLSGLRRDAEWSSSDLSPKPNWQPQASSRIVRNIDKNTVWLVLSLITNRMQIWWDYVVH